MVITKLNETNIYEFCHNLLCEIEGAIVARWQTTGSLLQEDVDLIRMSVWNEEAYLPLDRDNSNLTVQIS